MSGRREPTRAAEAAGQQPANLIDVTAARISNGSDQAGQDR
jgi:hypothetical protein